MERAVTSSKGRSPPSRRRPTPKYDRRSPVEWRILVSRRLSRRDRNGEPAQRRRRCASRIGMDALPDGHIDFLNQRWCEYTGLSVEEALGVDEAHSQGWQAPIHPEDLPELIE